MRIDVKSVLKGRICSMKSVKVSSKGKITIPVEIRTSLGIDEHSYLEVLKVGEEIRLRKLVRARALGSDDPIWGLIGAAASGDGHVAEDHDRYLAKSEIAHQLARRRSKLR
jgi:AbrB family looped-hinge helix DNA binding protein